MLNPTLYHSLRQQFGRVKIHHENYEAHEQLVLNRHGNFDLEYRHGEYYVVCCPFCRDTKYRLYFSYLWGVPNPKQDFRCNWNLALCFNEDCVRNREHRDYLAMVLYQLLPGQRPQPVHIERGIEFSDANREFEAPGLCTPLMGLPYYHQSHLYLKARAYDPEYVANTFFVDVCTTAAPRFPMMQDRINAPIYLRGNAVGWQGRVPADLNWKECGLPKYFNWPGMSKSEILYNFDGAIRYRTIVLYEGVTKVWRLGLNGIATLGTSISPRQLQLLAELIGHDGALVMATDPDTWVPNKHNRVIGQETFDKLNQAFPGRVAVLRADCDPGDLPRERSAEMIEASLRTIGCPYAWDEKKPVAASMPMERKILVF